MKMKMMMMMMMMMITMTTTMIKNNKKKNKNKKVCYYQLRRINSVRKNYTTEAAVKLVTSLILSRPDYCNALLTILCLPLLFNVFGACKTLQLA